MYDFDLDLGDGFTLKITNADCDVYRDSGGCDLYSNSWWEVENEEFECELVNEDDETLEQEKDLYLTMERYGIDCSDPYEMITERLLELKGIR